MISTCIHSSSGCSGLIEAHQSGLGSHVNSERGLAHTGTANTCDMSVWRPKPVVYTGVYRHGRPVYTPYTLASSHAVRAPGSKEGPHTHPNPSPHAPSPSPHHTQGHLGAQAATDKKRGVILHMNDYVERRGKIRRASTNVWLRMTSATAGPAASAAFTTRVPSLALRPAAPTALGRAPGLLVRDAPTCVCLCLVGGAPAVGSATTRPKRTQPAQASHGGSE